MFDECSIFIRYYKILYNKIRVIIISILRMEERYSFMHLKLRG